MFVLGYLLFVFTCIVGVAAIPLFFYWNHFKQEKKRTKTTTGSGKQLRTEDIPGWTNDPADERLGDAGVMAKHGSLHQYLVHRHKQEGPIIAFWMPGRQHCISLASPRMFRDTFKLFDRPECMLELFRPLITSESIEYANYEDGRNRRNVYDPAFRYRAIKSYFHVFIECAEEFLAQYDKPEDREKISLKHDCSDLILKTFFRTSLGDVFSSEEEVKEISAAYYRCWDDMESRLGGDFPKEGSEREKQFNKDREVVYGICHRLIDARKNSGESSGDYPFIDAILSTHVPDETTRADVISFLIGALHTSAYFMVWSLYFLGNHPEVQDKIYEEIVSVLGEGEVTFDAVKKMSYLRQVQNEVLRISTLAPQGARFPQEDIIVGGYPVPAMTPIVHALGVVSEDENVWSDPEVFDPDRFTPEKNAKREPNSFVPFGFGRRICPGYIFANVEIGVYLAMLLRRYSITMVTTKPAQKVYGLVTCPKEDVFVKFHPR